MEVNIDIIKDKVIISFKPMLVRTTKMEMVLTTDDVKADRPIRNLTDTLLDDIISEIEDLQKTDPKRYNKVMEQIIETRTLNNVAKTVEDVVEMKKIDIFYTLAEASTTIS